MKFDLILTNPPFQDTTNRRKTPHKLWIDFTQAVTFATIDSNDVCRVDVGRVASPIFMRSPKTDGDFYVRLNNSTRLLTTVDAPKYVSSHWE